MTFFSIQNVLTQKIIKNIVDINYHVIHNDLVQIKRERKENIPLSLIHPKECQPKIPMKDWCSLIRPNLKTTDDIFDIQSSINFILVYSEDIEFNNIHPYYKWECENYSEEYGYTHFYIVVSSVYDLPYYAIELQRLSGSTQIINSIFSQLTERLNILS